MASESDSGKLLSVKAKVGATGGEVELEVGAGAAGALALLMPGWTTKRHAKIALAAGIVDKFRSGQPLDDAEVLYASEVLGEAEARLIRRQQIQTRAIAAYQHQQALCLPEAPTGGAAGENNAGAQPQGLPKPTSKDWVSKYWDDASSVSDEVLQEVYARVLASEASNPGACSLRTLRALRYLDKDVAEDFANLASLVFDGMWLPEERSIGNQFGISYAMILNLRDAGLISSPAVRAVEPTANGEAYFQQGTKRLRITGVAADATHAAIPLTTAGRELYRVAQFDERHECFLVVASCLGKECRSKAIEWAQVPRGWQGSESGLNWLTVSP